MGITATRTYVELELSRAAYEEIAQKLRVAGYDHCFDGETIDMHGLGVTPEPDSGLLRCTLTGFIIATYFKAEIPKP